MGTTVPAEGDGGYGYALILLALGAVYLVLLGPIALLLGRDAARHNRDGWMWGLLFLWQPMFVGAIYLVIRRRPPRRPMSGPG